MPMGGLRSPERERDAAHQLETGRVLYRQCAWRRAFDAFTAADRHAPLAGGDLESLATCAYLVGRDDDYLTALERAYEAHLAAGAALDAARPAFWLGLRLLFRGEAAHASGWLSRAARLVDEDNECAERGYLLLPDVEQALGAGAWDRAGSLAARAREIGERCGDASLSVCARHLEGRALLGKGEIARGLAALDEAMVGVASGKLSPIVTGLVYCSVIEAYQQVHETRRAREWTLALARWCEAQPEMVAFTGACLAHRAQIFTLHGAWSDAIEAARRGGERSVEAANRRAAAAAFYQAGEVHRLRGDFDAAEEAYRNASRAGVDPQPGLALLRLAQGRTDLAASAMRRAAATATRRFERLGLLAAGVEIMLAALDLDAARAACAELGQMADELGTELALATAAHARGEVALAGGDAAAAAAALAHAARAWQELEAPYPAARARVGVAQACRALGDEEAAALELEAARSAFAQLGAAPDLARVAALAGRRRADAGHGLTRRELQVLRLVAMGKTNRGIATELCLSEKTIDRHVSNIFAKLGVASRAAAAAYACRHHLA